MDNCSELETEYAYMGKIGENIKISVSEYSVLVSSNKPCKVYCKNGHELIPVINVKKRIQHFRHKHCEDNPMSEWHLRWQSEFPVTEQAFKNATGQIKDRRADICIPEYGKIIELQHSYITPEEVNNRKTDYSLHKYDIIWLIDGEDIIEVSELNNNRIYIMFRSKWAYGSFCSHDTIFIDYEEKIYKIYPKYVKNNMIDVESPYTHQEFIKMVKTNDKSLSDIIIPPQCTLYINQFGAGNGKTFNIIQKLGSDDFVKYETIIVITKQHSAKNVINKELCDQYANKQISNISELELLNNESYIKDKKYIYSYVNTNTKKKYHLVICTVDSLMYKLGDTTCNGLDKFKNIVLSIIDDYIEKKNKNSIKYININNNLYLNKNMCLMIDEVQDLSEIYALALLKIIRSRYIDLYVIGDILQSIITKKNALKYFMETPEFSYVKKELLTPVNICRRFTNQHLIDFCNSVIDFEKYNVPKIEPYKQCTESLKSCLELVNLTNTIKKQDNTPSETNVDTIMNIYIREVENNNYKPNDFLIVTPFTKKNYLVEKIEVAINKYWCNKYKSNDYVRYAYFHKSEEGTTIDTTLSMESTRIVSIHSSKGDGRNVVIVIGCNEGALKKFTNNKQNLKYESLFHVAVTRMKNKLIFTYIANGDNIHRRLQKYGDEFNMEVKNNICNMSNKIKYSDIITTYTNEENFTKIYNLIIQHCDKDGFTNKENIIIDMQHHNIRAICMSLMLWLKIYKNCNQNKNQLYHIFNDIKKAVVNTHYDYKTYFEDLNHNKRLSDAKLDDRCNERLQKTPYYIPILFYNDDKSVNSKYKKYGKIISDHINYIKTKINNILKGNYVYLCSYEYIILYYMWHMCKYGNMVCDLNITELYHITHTYYTSFKKNDDHKHCNCHKYFKNNINSTFLGDHYYRLDILGTIYDNFLNKHKKVNFLPNKYVKYDGANKDFTITNSYVIMYDDTHVYNIKIHPTCNAINYNTYLIESIYDTYLIKNIKISSEITEDFRFENKMVKTILFTCDSENYKEFNWISDSVDYIDKYSQLFLNDIHCYMKQRYLSQLNNYQNYLQNRYEYYVKDNKPYDAVKKFEDTGEICFIKAFATEVVGDIRKVRRKHKNNEQKIKDIINNYIYDNQEFNTIMGDIIEEKIMDYLGIK